MAAESSEHRPAEPLTAAERLALPLESLRGVGYDRAQLLRKLRLRTVRDLLYFFPRSYQDQPCQNRNKRNYNRDCGAS